MILDTSLSGMNPSPAYKALQILKNDAEAAKRLAEMDVRISEFTGTLNIFQSTIDDLKYFAKILNNEEYSYDPAFKLTSFYY